MADYRFRRQLTKTIGMNSSGNKLLRQGMAKPVSGSEAVLPLGWPGSCGDVFGVMLLAGGISTGGVEEPDDTTW